MLKRERKLNRLKDYDYSQFGYYYVTICTKNREEFFGDVIGGKMVLNKYGKITNACWRKILNHFNNAQLDGYIIMPNHLHGIVVLNDDFNNFNVGNRHACSLQIQKQNQKRQYQKLPIIVGSFKSSVTRIINKSQNEFLFQWQKSFFDRIIRNQQELRRIQKYIINNPEQWHLDRNNPKNLQS